MTLCDLDTSLPDWIIDHPETLAVFQELDIDYSCGGKSLAYMCRELGLDAEVVPAKLLRCNEDEKQSDEYDSFKETGNGNSTCAARRSH